MVMAMGFSRDQAVKALKNTVSTETSFLNLIEGLFLKLKKISVGWVVHCIS